MMIGTHVIVSAHSTPSMTRYGNERVKDVSRTPRQNNWLFPKRTCSPTLEGPSIRS